MCTLSNSYIAILATANTQFGQEMALVMQTMCNPSLVWEIRLLKVVVWWVVVVKCYGVEPEKQEAETKMLK